MSQGALQGERRPADFKCEWDFTKHDRKRKDPRKGREEGLWDAEGRESSGNKVFGGLGRRGEVRKVKPRRGAAARTERTFSAAGRV